MDAVREAHTPNHTSQGRLDCLVIGGGPAGLTAAIYLARFHLSVVVIDGGNGRLATVPKTRNHPGFPDGIAGAELLLRTRKQAERYGAIIRVGEIVLLEKAGDVFVGSTAQSSLAARTVILATGVVNRRPAMRDDVHDTALATGLLRYCPICDAYELTDQPLAVLGTGERAVGEAEFLRGYTNDVTVIAPEGSHDLSASQRQRLHAASAVVLEGPCLDFDLRADRIDILLPGGRHSFASVYPALGSDVRSEHAVSLGAKVSKEGGIIVDSHQRTSVPGLYAAGDVVLGLDQISNAMGGGGIAATTVRNDLAAARPLRR